MIRVSVYYPNQSGTTFNHEYYAGTHAPFTIERLAPLGLRRGEIDRGIAGFGGAEAPYTAAGHLYFDSVEAFQHAWSEQGDAILADIPNYTDVQPVVQISDIVVDWPP